MMKIANELLAKTLLILAMSAVAAGAAHAAESEWTAEGETFAELAIGEEEVSLEGGPLSFELPGGVKITCSKVEGSGTLFQGGTDKLTGTLTSCEVSGFPGCKVTKPVPFTVKSELLLTGGAFYDRFEAQESGGPLAVITTEGCFPLPKEMKVTGAVAAEVPQEELEKPPIKFSAALSEKVNKELAAEGKAELKLSVGASTVKMAGSFVPPYKGPQAKKKALRNRPTALCEAKGMGNICPLGEIFAPETSVGFFTELEIRFIVGIWVIKCASSGLTMPTGPEINTSAPLRGTLTEAGFEGCEWEAEECPVVPETPRRARYETTGMGNGTITVFKPSFIIVCAGLFCRYDTASIQFTYSPTAGELTAPPVKFLKNEESNKECAGTGTWEGIGGGNKGVIRYNKVTEPGPAVWYINS